MIAVVGSKRMVGVLRPAAAGGHRQFSNYLKTEDDLQLRQNGRQSVSGVTATVFGGNGFVGRYLINRLGRIGSQVVVPYRGDGMNVRHLKLMGDLGQIVPIPIDFTNEDSLRKALERSNVVINLIGGLHQTKNYSYHDTNVKCTYRLTKLAAETGLVKKFIHMSCLGAAEDSPSDLLRAKAESEEVVREFFPKATVIRSAPIYGAEDWFLNRYAQIANFGPIIPVINGGKQKLQPVFVQDVAQAIVNSLTSELAPGKIVEVAGPETFTQKQIAEYVAREIFREDVNCLSLPEIVAKNFGKVSDAIFPSSWRLITPDSVDQQNVDLIYSNHPDHLKLADLKIKARTLAQESAYIMMMNRGTRVRPMDAPTIPR